jgi:DNA-binding protein YbaB
MEDRMDLQNTILKKETKQLISTVSNKMKEMGDGLYSNNILFEDKDKGINIVINGKQQIKSINISNSLFSSMKKNEMIEYLMRMINLAIGESYRANITELLKFNYQHEFDEVISKEPLNIQASIEIYKKGLDQIQQLLDTIQKSARSKSDSIGLTMLGTKKLRSLEINPEYLAIENKSKIEEELVESINRVIREINQEVGGKLEEKGMKLNQDIEIK